MIYKRSRHRHKNTISRNYIRDIANLSFDPLRYKNPSIIPSLFGCFLNAMPPERPWHFGGAGSTNCNSPGWALTIYQLNFTGT